MIVDGLIQLDDPDRGLLEAKALTYAAGHTAHQTRRYVARLLVDAGFGVVPSTAPFVLIDTTPCGPDSVRLALSSRGFAVRRGESFPGLGPTWIRVKVPEPGIARDLVAALSSLVR